MRVAVVTPKYGLIGGAESFAYELTECLADQEDLEVHVLSNQWTQGKSTIFFHKIPIIPFPRWLRPVSFAYFSQKAIHAKAYDVVHSHDRIFRMDFFTMHGIPHKTWVKEARQKPLSLFDRSMAWVEKRGLNGPSFPTVMPVSSLVKEELLKLYDIPESKIQIIHPGVSENLFSALDPKACRYEIRRRYGFSSSDIVVLFVGMNFEVKRLDLVIEGIAGLVKNEKRSRRVRLLVVGRGNTNKYLSISRDLGIADRVVFVGVTSKMGMYYLASDIFAMPSRFDTFGLAVLEAMTAGLPVIITRNVGARDLIDPGIHGFILSSSPSPSDITAALTSLMEREKRLKIGENARGVALKYDWNRAANQVTKLYRGFRKTSKC